MALRVTYVGELGWELHVPVEFAATVYDALMAAGRPHGIANAGYRAIEIAAAGEGLPRLGRRHRPGPLAARWPGLGWAVKLEAGHAVPGPRGAARSSAAGRLPRLLAGFTADPEVVLLGRETIYRDGERVGWLGSAGYGYTVGRSIGYGYVRDPAGVDRAHVLAGSYELEVAGERVPAAVFLEPPMTRREPESAPEPAGSCRRAMSG